MDSAVGGLRARAIETIRTRELTPGRTIWDHLRYPKSRAAVEIAERYARGAATDAELDVACREALAVTALWSIRTGFGADWGAAAIAFYVTLPDERDADEAITEILVDFPAPAGIPAPI